MQQQYNRTRDSQGFRTNNPGTVTLCSTTELTSRFKELVVLSITGSCFEIMGELPEYHGRVNLHYSSTDQLTSDEVLGHLLNSSCYTPETLLERIGPYCTMTQVSKLSDNYYLVEYSAIGKDRHMSSQYLNVAKPADWEGTDFKQYMVDRYHTYLKESLEKWLLSEQKWFTALSRNVNIESLMNEGHVTGIRYTLLNNIVVHQCMGSMGMCWSINEVKKQYAHPKTYEDTIADQISDYESFIMEIGKYL